MRALLAVPILAIASLAHAQPEPDQPVTSSPPALDPVAACKAERHARSEQAQQTADLVERARLLRSLPDCGAPATVAASAGPPAPAAPAIAEAALVGAATGFAIEIHLETAQIALDNNNVLPTTAAGIFLGYRSAGITIGVGLDVSRLGHDSSSGGQSNSSSLTSLLVLPGVRVPLARSDDGRVELLGQLDAGYGTISQSTSSTGPSSPSIGHVRVQAGPGLRYWVAPQFAVGATAGLRLDRLSQSMDSVMGAPSSDQSSSNLALFSSLQLTGVF